MTVRELEDAVWEVEGIRLIVRASPETPLAANEYWSKAAPQTWSLSEWRRKRLDRVLRDYTSDIIGPSGLEPHGRTLLSTIRGTYTS